MKKSVFLLLYMAIIFLPIACSSHIQSPISATSPIDSTPAPLAEVHDVASHVDVIGVWNAGGSQHESTNTANIVFDRKKFEFTDNFIFLDDLVVIEYEWLDTNRQIWKDTPATAGWGGLKINLLVSIRRDENDLTITIKDGFIRLQQ